MSEESQVTSHQSPVTDSEEEETSLLDFLIVLAKHKTLVLGVTVVAAILAVVVSLLLPNIYTATVKLLPPQQGQSTTQALLAQFGALLGGAAPQIAARNPSDLYVGMLKSRTVADGLIARFELQKIYDKSTLFDTRKQLAEATRIISGREGIIAIDFEDKDPKRAAAVANGYAEELYKLTSSIAITEASQRRLFFENQLKQAREQLALAEFSLRQSIDKGGLAGVDVQSRAILEPSAQLRAQIALREVQLSAIRIFATDQHPDIERLRHEITSMKRELGKLEGGDGKVESTGNATAGFENLRRFKDVKFLERLAELLTQQFEAAKIDEAKDSSVIQVLDRALEPEKRSRPARTQLVIISVIVGLLLGIGLAFLRERWEKLRADPSYVLRLAKFREYLRLR